MGGETGEDYGETLANGPIEDVITLDDDGPCIAEARHRAAAFLVRVQHDHQLVVPARVVALTQLAVSELVTNARKHAPGPARLRIRLTGRAVEVTVWDTSPALPTARPADPERVGQHGLEIVTALAQRVEVRQEPPGKSITAHIGLDPGPEAELSRTRAV